MKTLLELRFVATETDDGVIEIGYHIDKRSADMKIADCFKIVGTGMGTILRESPQRVQTPANVTAAINELIHGLSQVLIDQEYDKDTSWS